MYLFWIDENPATDPAQTSCKVTFLLIPQKWLNFKVNAGSQPYLEVSHAPLSLSPIQAALPSRQSDSERKTVAQALSEGPANTMCDTVMTE